MPSEAQDDLLVSVALANLSYKFRDVDAHVEQWAWELSQEYAGRQGLDPGEAVDQIVWDINDPSIGGIEASSERANQ